MKTQKSTTKKKQALGIIVLCVILLIGGYLLYGYVTRSVWPFQTQETTVEPSEETDGNSSSQTTNTETSAQPENTTDKTPVQYDTPETTPATNNSTAASLPIEINFNEVQNNNLVLRVTINKTLASGTCTLQLSKAGSTSVTQTAPIIANPSSSTCRGFNVPTANLASGIWNAKITAKSGELSGSTSVEVRL